MIRLRNVIISSIGRRLVKGCQSMYGNKIVFFFLQTLKKMFPLLLIHLRTLKMHPKDILQRVFVVSN